MKPELIDRVLDGYTEIIRDLLDSKDPMRFERIARIAKLAQALRQQTALRVAEIDGGGIYYDEELANQVVVGGGVMRNIHQPRLESTDILREIVGAIQPVVGLYMQQARHNMQRAQEQRLSELVNTRAELAELELPTDAIDQRIARLNANIAEEEREDADPSVVHPELLWGHSVGADGSAELQGDHGESDSPGNGCAPETPCDSHEEGLADIDG